MARRGQDTGLTGRQTHTCAVANSTWVTTGATVNANHRNSLGPYVIDCATIFGVTAPCFTIIEPHQHMAPHFKSCGVAHIYTEDWTIPGLASHMHFNPPEANSRTVEN